MWQHHNLSLAHMARRSEMELDPDYVLDMLDPVVRCNFHLQLALVYGSWFYTYSSL